MKKAKIYAISIAISLGVGVLAQLFTMENMNIYDEIRLPPFTPPSWLFPVVWGILYTLMGISAAMIYQKDKSRLGIYALQLVVNFIWCIIFFNFREFFLSFLWLLLLWVLILMMILRFYKIDKWAAWLQLPYLHWVSFAAYLNFMIYLLN